MTELSQLDIEIIQAMCEEDMNICAVARKKYLHHNTVSYHLDKIKKKTGLDPRKFHDLIKLETIVKEYAFSEEKRKEKTEMKKQWNYIEKDGNPKEPGIYWVTLIHPEWKDGKETGKLYAEVDSRYYADLNKNPDLKLWIMEGEPKSGLAWTEEVGSIKGERVYAWMPIESVEVAKLPKGVIKA